LPTQFSGAVLAGGSSRRMGTDKAFVEVDGEPLAERARRALVAAGADDVHAVGGDLDRLAQLGFLVHPDDHPAQGPLGGLLVALRVAAHPTVVVLACDMPAIDSGVIDRVVAASSAVDAAVPVSDGVPQPLVAAYSTRARLVLERAFASGERSPSHALDLLHWREVESVEPARLIDLDDPSDVARYASQNRLPHDER
jgi:molybdopterin-guanine dinucleotide biosynthesis protein A